MASEPIGYALPVMRLVLALLLAGCGARTALEQDEADAAQVVAETCNGLDDDGDGAIDEGIAPITCGTGACLAESPGCAGGAVPMCVPGPPSMERCNGADDDCDGRVDEGLGLGAIGEPIVVRDVDEHGDDRCSTCAMPFYPDLVPLGDGIFVTWRLGMLGTDPVPNTFARQVDHGGRPAGPIELLFEPVTTSSPRTAPGPEGAALVYCGRRGSRDKAVSALVDRGGAVLDETLRAPTDRSCGAWSPDALWAGERWLFAWTDNSSGPVEGHEVLLDVADARGASLGARTLEPNAASGPRMAAAHGRAVLVVDARPEPRRSRIAVHRLDPRGAALGEPIYLDVPDGTDDAFATPFVVPSATGFTVHAASARRDGGRFVAALAADGTPLGAIERLDTGVGYVNGFDDVIARSGGGALLASPTRVGDASGYTVLSLGEDGRTIGAWTPEAMEESFAWGALLEHRGRVFLAYVAILGDNRGQVRLRELGCR